MREKGFTLIEILIALVILLVGLVGILALYPPGIQNAKDASEDSTIATIARDLHAALQTAIRKTPPGEPVEALLRGVPGGILKFPLPPAPVEGKDASPWYVFPSKNRHTIGEVASPPGDFPGTNTGGNVGWVYNYCVNEKDDGYKNLQEEDYMTRLQQLQKKYESSDITCQFSYSFDVRRRGQEPLYEFRLKIYRSFDNYAPSVPPEKIPYTTFSFYLAGNGG